MSLKLKDLQEEEARLIKAHEHIESELSAIQTLIEGRRLRGEGVGQSAVDIRSLSVEKAVIAIHRELGGKWVSGAEMMEDILRRDANKEGKSLRASIGNAQRKLFNEERLERKNIGDEAQPKYLYRWSTQE